MRGFFSIDFEKIYRLPKMVKSMKVRFFFFCSALFAWHAWAYRFDMNPDGISYLDLGDIYAVNPADVNAYWNPLYSIILKLFLSALLPLFQYEVFAVHFTNWIIALFAAFCFDQLIDSGLAYARKRVKLSVEKETEIRCFGYLVFVSYSLQYAAPSLVTPDLLMSAFLYLSLAIFFQAKMLDSNIHVFFLGVITALGYLTKSPFFCLALVFAAMLVVDYQSSQRALLRALIFILAFGIVAGPFIYAISKKEGHWTIGTSGSFNYSLAVNEEPIRLTAEKISADSGIYYFKTAREVTFPLHYDAPEWADKQRLDFDLNKQTLALKGGLKNCLGLAMPYFIPLLILAFASWRFSRKRFIELSITWLPLGLLGLSGLALYSVILVQPRYVFSFFILTGLFFGAVTFPFFSRTENSLYDAVLKILYLLLILSCLRIAINDGRVAWTPGRDHVLQVAQKIKESGVDNGEIAVAGDRSTAYWAYWARLSKLRITALVEAPLPWQQEDEDAYVRQLKKFPLAAIIAENKSGNYRHDDWIALGDDLFLKKLK